MSSKYTLYSSVNSNSLEVKNPIDINSEVYSTELIGQYNKASAVANNAQHKQLLFEDFEAHSRNTKFRKHRIPSVLWR